MPLDVAAYVDELRRLGRDDDTILKLLEAKGLKEPDPIGGLRIPFDKLRKGGAVPTRQIEPQGPDNLAQALSEAANKRFLDPAARGGQGLVRTVGGFAQGLGSALEQSADPRMKGRVIPPVPGAAALGRALKEIGGDISQPAQKTILDMIPKNRRSFWKGMQEAPLETLTEHGLENLPNLIFVMGTMAATGGTAGPALGSAFMLEAGNAYNEAKDAGATESQAVNAAGLTGLVNASLEMVGAGKALEAISGKKAVRKLFMDIGKAMLTEGSTETAQEFVGNLSALATYAGERGLTVGDIRELFSKEAIAEYGAAGVIGAFLSGGVTFTGNLGRVASQPQKAPPAPVAAPVSASDPKQVPQAPPGVSTLSEAEIQGELVGEYLGPERRQTPPEFEYQGPERRRAMAEAVPEATKVIGRIQPDPSTVTPDQVVGRPELANPGIDQQVRDFNNAIIEERERATIPENRRRADEVVTQEAVGRLLSNGIEQEATRFLAHGLRTDVVDTAVARILMEEASKRALATGKQEDLIRARELRVKYYEEGSEIARALRFRRDAIMSPAQRTRQSLRDALLTPSPTLMKRLDAARTTEEKVAAEAAYAQEMQEARSKLAEMGIDLDTILSEDTPMTSDVRDEAYMAMQAVSGMRAEKGAGWEYWRAMILMNPATHAANAIGNFGFLGNEFFVQRPMEELINKAYKDPNSAQAGEVRAAVKGLMDRQSFARAWDFARRTFRTERSVFSEEVAGEMVSKIDDTGEVEPGRRGPAAKITGPVITNPLTGKKTTLGRVVRTPFRLLTAADEFAKSLIYEMTLHTAADRIARAEGYTPEETELFIEDAINNPTPEMMRQAYDEALYLTFQSDLGDIGKGALGFRRRVPALTAVAPFVTTPINIAKVSLRKSPLGILPMLVNYTRVGHYKLRPGKGQPFVYEKSKQVRGWAEQIMAWGSIMALLALTDDEEDLPRVTGSQDPDPKKRSAQYRGAPPTSIRIGNAYYSYSRIEPFAFPLAAAVDTVNMIRRAANNETTFQNEWNRGMATLTTLVTDKTFMNGLDDIFEAYQRMERGDGGDKLSAWATNFASAWLPASGLVKAVGRASTGEFKDVRPSEGVTYWKERLDILGHKTLPFDNAPLRYDVWGRPMKHGDITGHPASDFFYRLLSPIRAAKIRRSEVDRLIKNWNNANPDNEWLPIPPRRTVMIKGNEVEMTREEYQEFIRRRGIMAHERLLDMVESGGLDPDNPTIKDIKRIRRVLDKSQRRVKRMMFGDR